MADFTLRQLEFFVALSRHETFAAAAHELHISESGLSHAISELERGIDETLCHRRKAKGFTLTPFGRAFAIQARRVIAEANRLRDGLEDEPGDLRGPIALGAHSGFASAVIPLLLDEFITRNPNVQINSTIGAREELLGGLERGQLDLAFLYEHDLVPGLHTAQIYETELRAVSSPATPYRPLMRRSALR